MTETITPPWTIKGVDPDVREAAIEAAKRDRRTQGEWLTLAIREKIQRDREVGRELATIPTRELTTVVDKPAPQPELSSLERAVEIAGKLAAATGKPPPSTFTRPVYARLLAQAVVGQD